MTQKSRRDSNGLGLRGALAGLLLLLVQACRTVGDTGVVSPAQEALLLPAPVTDGQTTREDLVLLFGAPIAQFEGSHLVVHRLIVGEDRKLRPLFSRTDEMVVYDRKLYDLVLVFEKDVVSRHSLVKIR